MNKNTRRLRPAGQFGLTPVGAPVGAARPLLTEPRLALALIAALELAVLRAVTYRRYSALSSSETPAAEMLFALHTAGKALLLALVLLGAAALISRRLSGEAALRGAPRLAIGALHVLCFVALLAVVAGLPTGDAELTPQLETAYTASTGLFVTWTLSAAALLTARGTLRRIRLREVGYVSAIIIATLVWLNVGVGEVRPQQLFERLVEGTTLSLSLAIHAFLSGEVAALAMDQGEPVMFSDRFAISIAASCAGHRGMLSTFFLLGGVAALEWRALRPLRAAALILAAVVAVFLMNALRIALLFRLGETISPEVAVNGFHNQFGALSLLLVAGAAAIVMRTAPFRRTSPAPVVAPTPVRAWRHEVAADAAVMAAPLAVLMLTGMLAGLFAGAFDWLYPVSVVTGAAMIWMTRARLAKEFEAPLSLAGLVFGVAVFAVWIAMIPPDAARSAVLSEALAGAPAWLAALWILFRVLGSSVVVPIVEEMAIRGGLMRLTEAAARPFLPARVALVLAVALSSTLFGLLHVDVAAAVIAGLAYGALAAWRGSLGDAIVAHAVTNFLICIYVLAFGEWSYW